MVGVQDVHVDGEHGDVLVDLRLRFDFQDAAVEPPVRVRVDGDRHRHTGPHLADVGLIDERRDLHRVEVRDLQDDRAAAHVVGRARDHRTEHGVELEDGAGDRRPDLGVLHRILGRLQVGLGRGDGGLGGRIGELGGLVVALGNGLALVERVAAFELRGRVLELCLGHIEVRLGLGQVVLRDAWVDLRQQLSLPHLVPRLHRLGEDLPGGLGLHAQRQDRLNHAGGGGRDDDVAAPDRDRGVGRRGFRLLAGGAAEQYQPGRRRAISRHHPSRHLEGVPCCCCWRSPGSPPPVTFWKRWRNCCCACTSDALGSTRTVSRSVRPLVTSM